MVTQTYRPHKAAESLHPMQVVQKFYQKPYIYVGKEHGWEEGITVARQLQPPAELVTAPMATHVFMCVLSDSSFQTTRVGDSVYEGANRRGAFIIYPAGMPGYFRWQSAGDTITLLLEPTFLQRVALETCNMNPDRVELIPRPTLQDPQLERIFLLYHHDLLWEQGASGRLYAEALTNLLALHLLHTHCAFPAPLPTQKGGLSAGQLRHVYDYIRDHLAQPLSLATLAATIHLNPVYFARQFKAATGMAPHQYVIQQRVRRAYELLRQGRLSIAEIARQTGFTDQSHLHHHFKRIYGITPGAVFKQ